MTPGVIDVFMKCISMFDCDVVERPCNRRHCASVVSIIYTSTPSILVYAAVDRTCMNTVIVISEVNISM